MRVLASISELAELPGPPVVVFQDLDTPVMSATFGEVMCTTYKAFGAAGLITSGAGRDLDQVEAIGFPCFTNGTICSHGDCHIVQLGVPVHVYWGGKDGFDPKRVWKIPFHSGYEASAADLNADGYVDLILLDSGHAGGTGVVACCLHLGQRR